MVTNHLLHPGMILQVMKQTDIRHQTKTSTLPETKNFAPENGWLEYDSFLLGPGPFSGANC